MPVITDIVVQQKNKSRSSIFIDHVFFAGASNFVIRQQRLTIGQTVDKDLLEQVLFEDSVEKAKGYVVDYLLHQSTANVQKKLHEKGYEARVIERVLAFIENYHLIDDAVYAQKKTKDLINFGKKGPRVIAQTLRQNGIEASAIEEAIGLVSHDEQVHAAQKALRTKLTTYRKKATTPYALKQKCYAYLYGRGFTTPVIEEVLEIIAMEEDRYDEI